MQELLMLFILQEIRKLLEDERYLRETGQLN